MNDENLKGHGFHERTASEQREIAKKGGKASGAARGFRSALKRRLNDNPDELDNVLDALYEEAAGGNINAIRLMIELYGEASDDLDKKLKRAQLAKIKAETDEIRRRHDDGDSFSEEERRSLADALTASESIWKGKDNETS